MEELARSIAMSLGIDPGITGGITMLVFALIILLVFVAPVAGILSFVERRVAGRMMSRIGPNRVGPNGILQFVADGLKALQKEDIIPDGADRPLFKLAPLLCFVGVFGTFAALPWGKSSLIASDLNVGLLYVISITSLVVIGVLMAGWASNNKWSLLGGMRAAAQIVSYEIPLAIALVPAILTAGSLSMSGLMSAQGWLPWDWFIFDSPFAFVAFFIFFIAALAEGNRTPFDIPEGESELVAGYFTEYSGFRFVFFFFAEWTNLYVIGAVATTIFLGGGNLPGVVSDSITLSILVFMLKSFTLVFVIIHVRWTLPRFRVDQLMELCWKVLTPFALVTLFGQAIYLIIEHAAPALSLIVSLATFGVFILILLKFVSRVRTNIKEQSIPINAEP